MKRVARMVRALYVHRQHQFSKGRKLHATDEHFFKDAEALLFDELSYVLGIEPDEVSEYLGKRLAV